MLAQNPIYNGGDTGSDQPTWDYTDPNKPGIRGLPAPGSGGAGSYQPPAGWTYDPSTGLYYPPAGFQQTPGGVPGQSAVPPPTAPSPAAGPAAGPPSDPAMSRILAPFTDKFVPPDPGAASGEVAKFWPKLPTFGMDTTAPKPFELPDPNNLETNREYQFIRDQGNKSIINQKAAQGTLGSGATLKDFMTWNQNLADTKYQDLANNALTQWNTNYGQWKDTILNPTLADTALRASANQRQSELDRSNAWQEYLNKFDIFKYNEQWPYTVLSDQQKIGLNATQ